MGRALCDGALWGWADAESAFGVVHSGLGIMGGDNLWCGVVLCGVGGVVLRGGHWRGWC